MRTIEEIRADCEAHEICKGYKEKWSSAKSRKELFDMGCSIQGMEFLVRCSDGGFGFTHDEICHIFRHYLNHEYVSVQYKGTEREYDGAIWCGFEEEAFVDVTCALFLGCSADVRIVPNHICHIFSDKASKLRIIAPESSTVVFHGNPVSVDMSLSEGRIRMR